MKSKYRFRHQKGRFIQVTFAHIPSKWFSTGTHKMTDAVLWAEHKLRDDMQSNSTVRKNITLKEFSTDFFSDSDPQGFRLRNEKKPPLYHSLL
jgi:hypothetical protein